MVSHHDHDDEEEEQEDDDEDDSDNVVTKETETLWETLFQVPSPLSGQPRIQWKWEWEQNAAQWKVFFKIILMFVEISMFTWQENVAQWKVFF